VDEELITIGRFARLAGLSVGALRHYDAEGLLAPAHVDAPSGYRRYRRDQIPTARAIAALRDLELSIPSIRALLREADPAARARILGRERRRLEARTARLQRALHRLGTLADDATTITEDRVMPTSIPELPRETHRALGIALYNRTWDLMEIEDRTADQDDELVHTAHASAWHWMQVGTRANRARSEWLCSRVNAVLGRGDAALRHARRCVDLVEAGGDGFEDWDAAGAAEAMARALFVVGDRAEARRWRSRAAELVAAVSDPRDRENIERDVETLPA
jgi:DNA-binding transcriptional MerR regulator